MLWHQIVLENSWSNTPIHVRALRFPLQSIHVLSSDTPATTTIAIFVFVNIKFSPKLYRMGTIANIFSLFPNAIIPFSFVFSVSLFFIRNYFPSRTSYVLPYQMYRFINFLLLYHLPKTYHKSKFQKESYK